MLLPTKPSHLCPPPTLFPFFFFLFYLFIFYLFIFCFVLPLMVVCLNSIPLCTSIQNTKTNNGRQTSLGLEDARVYEKLGRVHGSLHWAHSHSKLSLPRSELREFQVEPGRACTSPILVKIGNSQPRPPPPALGHLKNKQTLQPPLLESIVDGGTKAYVSVD